MTAPTILTPEYAAEVIGWCGLPEESETWTGGASLNHWRVESLSRWAEKIDVTLRHSSGIAVTVALAVVEVGPQ